VSAREHSVGLDERVESNGARVARAVTDVVVRRGGRDIDNLPGSPELFRADVGQTEV
jgi:hypothetical protein